MKTPEEIEQLAESYLQKNKYNFDNWKEIVHVKQTYIACYTKCQEDMAKEYSDKKYTKEDVLKAGEIGEINHHDYKHIVSLLDEAKELNKTNKEFMSKETLDELFDLHDDDDFIHEDSDKKYTEEDMKKCWDACKGFIRPISEGYAPNFNEFIYSLKKLNKQD